MNTEKVKKFSNILSAVSITSLLIALLVGSGFIRIGTQNLIAIDNVDIDLGNFKEAATETEGEIVVMNATLTQIKYYVDGEEMTTDMQVYTDDYPVGSKVKLYYSNEDPTNTRAPELFISYYNKVGHMTLRIGIIICAVCGVIGGGALVLSKILRKKVSSGK